MKAIYHLIQATTGEVRQANNKSTLAMWFVDWKDSSTRNSEIVD